MQNFDEPSFCELSGQDVAFGVCLATRGGDWQAHLGHSSSLFVNAAAHHRQAGGYAQRIRTAASLHLNTATRFDETVQQVADSAHVGNL